MSQSQFLDALSATNAAELLDALSALVAHPDSESAGGAHAIRVTGANGEPLRAVLTREWMSDGSFACSIELREAR